VYLRETELFGKLPIRHLYGLDEKREAELFPFSSVSAENSHRSFVIHRMNTRARSSNDPRNDARNSLRSLSGLNCMQQTLVEKSYRYLRERLAHGELSAGSQLVNRTLAAAIGVSLGPLREAINRLSSEGLIEQVPGAGAFVRKPGRQELEDLYVLLETVEGTAAAEACRLIGDLQLEELDNLCKVWNRLAEELHNINGSPPSQQHLESYIANEERFDSIIVEAARNQVLAKVIREHRMLARVFGAQRLQGSALSSAVVAETARDHCEIVDALRRRDADAARAKVAEKVQKERKSVIRLFAALTPEAS